VLVLQVIALLFAVAVIVMLHRIETQFISMMRWVEHVNDKLVKIGYGISGEENKERVA